MLEPEPDAVVDSPAFGLGWPGEYELGAHFNGGISTCAGRGALACELLPELRDVAANVCASPETESGCCCLGG